MGMFNYKIRFVCANCGTEPLIKIPNGTLIQDFIKRKKGKCRYCKCKIFSTYYKVEQRR